MEKDMEKGAYWGICFWFIGGFVVAMGGDPIIQPSMAFGTVVGGLITGLFSR